LATFCQARISKREAFAGLAKCGLVKHREGVPAPSAHPNGVL